jgi:hypothetical protein
MSVKTMSLQEYEQLNTTHPSFDEGRLVGTAYRPCDAEAFPTAYHITSKTGRPVDKAFSIAEHVYELNPEGVMKLLKDNGYTEIYQREWYGSNYLQAMVAYEKIDDVGVTLVVINNVFKKWIKKLDSGETLDGVTANVYSNGSIENYTHIVDGLVKESKRKVHKSNNIALVIQTQRGYETQTFELPKGKLDVELNYGKGFKPIHEKIIGQLNSQNSKGLVLLHGTPGTGKTHYLKYLASKIKDKRVLFIPPYLADFITSPQMTPFLIENANSVLFIEDAENVITDRTSNGSTGVSNILNLTDGILSDILNIQIVATFNMDKKKIDSALLRKGRLIAEHKFDALPLDDTKRLLKHLGKDVDVTDGMTLTEIYNIDETEYKTEEKYSTIGFNR